MQKMTYEECAKQTGFHGLVYPKHEYKYFATVDGKEFEVTKKQSADYKKIRKEQQDSEALRKYQELRQKTWELWKKELYSSVDGFNSRTLDLIYDQAYEKGHAYGYDEVALYFFGYRKFC